MIDTSEDIARWLTKFADGALKDRVFSCGQLTGWRQYPDGTYGSPNFERALVLDRILRLARPARILEIGTGRGLGCLIMAQTAAEIGLDVKITTVDLTPPDRPIEWAARIDDRDEVLTASRNEMWGRHFPAESAKIEQIAGYTETVLPRLTAEKREFDFIFVDAGHDVFSVVHDLAYSAAMLAPGGLILMDDFAPEEEYGMGTCMVVPHVRRLFARADVFVTEGLVYGCAENPDFPRGMVLLQGQKAAHPRVSRPALALWKIFDRLFKLAYFSGRLFPIKS